MILRQFIVRHGRAAIPNSTKQTCRRWYASEISVDDGKLQQSNQNQESSLLDYPEPPSSIIDAISNTYNPMMEATEASKQESNTPRTSSSGRPSTRTTRPAFPPRQKTLGTHLSPDIYRAGTLLTNPPSAEFVTLEQLLANQCHLGHATALWHPGNSTYIYGIRQGIHIISLEITLSYLRRAAKVVQEVAKRGGVIVFVGTRKNMKEMVVKAAQRAGGYHIFDRWIPGSLTNGQQILERCALKVVDAADEELTQYREPIQNSSHAVLRPDLVICLNPLENEVCLHECGLYNVPTIGIVDTDCNPAWVTYPIPANDDSIRSLSLISGVLSKAAHKGQEMRKAQGREGKTLYSTKKVELFLKGMEEVSSFDVQNSADGGENKDKKGEE